MSASAYWKSKGHDKEAAKDLMLSMDTTNDEKRKFVNELEACNVSEESLDVEDEYIDDEYVHNKMLKICDICGKYGGSRTVILISFAKK